MARVKLSRGLQSMVHSLKNQLSLLEEYSDHAFVEKREKFYPEVASILRILIVRSRHNRPLLLDLASELNLELKVVLDGPLAAQGSANPEFSLDEFYDRKAATIRTRDGLVSMTKRELIRAWCEQLGGDHEDWAVDEALARAIQSPLLLNGTQPAVIELSNCSRAALDQGSKVLQHAGQIISDA